MLAFLVVPPGWRAEIPFSKINADSIYQADAADWTPEPQSLSAFFK